MPKFKNISTGDRGLYTTDGLLMVPAGATTDDVTLADNETPNEEWFEETEGGLSSLSIPELKALATEEGVDLGDAKKKADIIAAIELAREDAKD